MPLWKQVYAHSKSMKCNCSRKLFYIICTRMEDQFVECKQENQLNGITIIYKRLIIKNGRKHKRVNWRSTEQNSQVV